MLTLHTPRLRLEPLLRTHAPAMFELLHDAEVYRHLDDPPPPSVQALELVYARLESRLSADGREAWLNWALVRAENRRALGFVQATLQAPERVWVAYALGRRHWGQGYAREAMRAMLEHLCGDFGARRFLASVEAANQRSLALLAALGFHEAAAAQRAEHRLTDTERLWVCDAGGFARDNPAPLHDEHPIR